MWSKESVPGVMTKISHVRAPADSFLRTFVLNFLEFKYR